jgi:hypothetical protein
MSRLPSGPLEKDLRSVLQHKLGVHGVDTLKVATLRKTLEAYGVWESQSTRAFSEALIPHLEGVISSLPLAANLKEALRTDLALAFSGDAVPHQPQRGRSAAAAAGCSYETYRHNRSKRGIGHRKLAVQRLVFGLDPENRYGAYEPENEPKARTQASEGSAGGPANARYHPLEQEDLDCGFWWRPSTRDYIEQLASLPALTIFAGTDGDADVGPPLRRDVMLAMLRDSLNDDPVLAPLEGEDRNAAADHLIEEVRASGAREGYIGSIVRGLYAGRSGGWSDAEVEARLHNVVQLAAHGRAAGGYVSSAITRLAFSLCASGIPANVISAHYDSDLADAAQAVSKAHEQLQDCTYEPLFNERHTGAIRAKQVPLTMLNVPQRNAHRELLMVGEADAVSAASDRAARMLLLEEMFSQSSVLLVGTSLSDPGVLTAVARTRHSEYPRYALLPSPILETVHPRAPIADRNRPQLLAILASRYRYLGVIPIVVDFRYQIPQLLTEVAKRLVESRRYLHYADRIEDWWKRWAVSFGYGPEGDATAERSDAQVRWHERLRTLRDDMYASFVKTTRSDDEHIMIEVWLRDPRPQSRHLFRWANSEGIWERSQTTPVASLREVGDIIQKTFREGQTFWQETAHSDLGRWRYCVAMNLVLGGGPWADLPVGVIKVLSTNANGGIQHVKNSEAWSKVERLILDSMRELFNEVGDQQSDATRAAELSINRERVQLQTDPMQPAKRPRRNLARRNTAPGDH